MCVCACVCVCVRLNLGSVEFFNMKYCLRGCFTSFLESTGVACSDSVCHKVRSSKFREGSRVRQLPGGRRTYRTKRSGNKNKDEDDSPKKLNDKNHQASSPKSRQLKPRPLVTPTKRKDFIGLHTL